jgi:hypothetical protein
MISCGENKKKSVDRIFINDVIDLKPLELVKKLIVLKKPPKINQIKG